jgi:hypothetical protein
MPPSRIILLRHGEKPDKDESGGSFRLSDMGAARAQMIACRFLGSKATDPQKVLAGGQPPSAFFAITTHTFETISPSAQSWGLPVTCYSAVHPDNGNKQLDARTTQAADDVMKNPRWDGKTVVMVWEHKRIADVDNAGNPKSNALRQLLGFGGLTTKSVPKTWPDEIFGYFWVIDYKDGVAVDFNMVEQGDIVIPQIVWP